VDIVLELLDHTVGVLEGVLQRLGLKHAVTGGSLAGWGCRWVFWSSWLSFHEAVIWRRILRAATLLRPRTPGDSLCQLLVLGRELLHFALHRTFFGLGHGHIAPESREFSLVLLDLIDVVVVELRVHLLQLLQFPF
jgi:hypothetical protein